MPIISAIRRCVLLVLFFSPGLLAAAVFLGGKPDELLTIAAVAAVAGTLLAAFEASRTDGKSTGQRIVAAFSCGIGYLIGATFLTAALVFGGCALSLN